MGDWQTASYHGEAAEDRASLVPAGHCDRHVVARGPRCAAKTGGNIDTLHAHHRLPPAALPRGVQMDVACVLP
eukprot:SAG31_NODE_2635_length_5340_cov_15.869681_4_plen_73_part_00